MGKSKRLTLAVILFILSFTALPVKAEPGITLTEPSGSLGSFRLGEQLELTFQTDYSETGNHVAVFDLAVPADALQYTGFTAFYNGVDVSSDFYLSGDGVTSFTGEFENIDGSLLFTAMFDVLDAAGTFNVNWVNTFITYQTPPNPPYTVQSEGQASFTTSLISYVDLGAKTSQGYSIPDGSMRLDGQVVSIPQQIVVDNDNHVLVAPRYAFRDGVRQEFIRWEDGFGNIVEQSRRITELLDRDQAFLAVYRPLILRVDALVVDTEGNPLRGASVTLDRIETHQTDSTGRTVFTQVPRGRHTLRVQLDGYATVALRLLMQEDSTLSFTMECDPYVHLGAQLSDGTVLDETTLRVDKVEYLTPTTMQLSPRSHLFQAAPRVTVNSTVHAFSMWVDQNGVPVSTSRRFVSEILEETTLIAVFR